MFSWTPPGTLYRDMWNEEEEEEARLTGLELDCRGVCVCERERDTHSGAQSYSCVVSMGQAGYGTGGPLCVWVCVWVR